MIFDCFLFSGEINLLQLRLQLLCDHVDHFVITESTQAFSGTQKALEFSLNCIPSNIAEKVIYNPLTSYISDSGNLFEGLANSHHADDKRVLAALTKNKHYNKSQLNWLREAYQRERLISPLEARASLNDIILISDIDEIPDPKAIHLCNDLLSSSLVVFMEHTQYQFNLSCKSRTRWRGLYAAKYSFLLTGSLNHIRAIGRGIESNSINSLTVQAGWHLTNFGTLDQIRKKIMTYGHQEYNNILVKSLVPFSYWLGYDYLFRPSSLHYPSRVRRDPDLTPELVTSMTTFPFLQRNESWPKYYIRLMLWAISLPFSWIFCILIALISRNYKRNARSR